MAVLVGATAGVKGYVLDFATRVVERAGDRVGVVTSGYRPGARTTHGTESLHAIRQAVDIGARGAHLTRLGQAALALAGGNANATSWSGQDVNGWEIIFNSNEGGDHFNHLHLGWEGAPTGPQGGSRGMGSRGGFTFAELMSLWVQNGGSRQQAAMAAQVALLESLGDPNAHNKTIREDSWGLWQINVKAHPNYRGANLTDPTVNVRAAIAISKNGRDWGPWSTAAAARALLATRPASEKVPGGVTRPGGEGSGGGGFFGDVGGIAGDIFGGVGGIASSAWGDVSGIFGGAKDALEMIARLLIFILSPRNWLRLVEFALGFSLLMLGLATLLVEFSKKDTPTGRAGRALKTALTPNKFKPLTAFERGAERGVRDREYAEGRRAARQQETRSNPDAFRPRPVYRRRRGG